MSVKRPTPIRLLDQRLPQAGRIRAGRKVVSASGKTRPAALSKFRFTSKDRSSLEKVAKLYGGEVRAWDDRSSPDTWEVYTDAEEIRVLLPSGDPLGGTPIYELWSGGGCERRCDGETATMLRSGPEPVEHPCLCLRAGELSCKLKTRLSVILPDVRFLGTWRLDTNGENAARELPGMVAGVLAVQGEGLHRAVLRLDSRVEVKGGQRHEFVVPVLGVDATPEDMVSGSNRLSPGEGRPQIEPGVITPDDVQMFGNPEHLTVTDIQEVKSPELVRAWMEALTTSQQTKVLLAARDKAAALGWSIPSTFAEIDLDLADEVMGNGTP